MTNLPHPGQAPSIEDQIAMQKLQQGMQAADARLQADGYRPLTVQEAGDKLLMFGAKWDLNGDDPSVSLARTEIGEGEAPITPLLVGLEAVRVDGTVQIKLVGLAAMEGMAVVDTMEHMGDLQVAAQMGGELTYVLAGHAAGQIPDEALNSNEAMTEPEPPAGQTASGIILP